MGTMAKDKAAKISSLAGRAMGLARDDILVHLRFFDGAFALLPFVERPGLEGFATDGRSCLYDPVYILECYREDPRRITRALLHMLLHCVFSHGFRYDRMDAPKWDLAADAAVEGVILELGFGGAALEQDAVVRDRLEILKSRAGTLTAERLYRYFVQNPPSPQEEREMEKLFARDRHSLWRPGERLELTQAQWQKLSQRVKTDLKAFARRREGVGNLEKNLEEVTRERYDYGRILRRFTAVEEELAVSQEEFDYIYYTYGLDCYGNLPLIEPLEYKESKKVKEFVIAIDTSASCEGGAVRDFLKKTYSILKDSENFFAKINVHIIQCDSQVRSDTRLTCQADLEDFLRRGKLTGFGATDFRPVFEYVEELRRQGEFENLKGLIYFTDGYGIYPERMPDYNVVFAFLEEDENRLPVPPWSMKVVLEDCV